MLSKIVLFYYKTRKIILEMAGRIKSDRGYFYRGKRNHMIDALRDSTI